MPIIHRRFTSFVLALTLTSVPIASAQIYAADDGIRAYLRGDYETALKLLLPLAEKGNFDAQSTLGDMYSGGKGVRQDDAEAVRWWRKCAEYDNDCRVALGLNYIGGLGVEQDKVAGAALIRMAAESGNQTGQLNLGSLYSHGDGVPQDYVQAYMWFYLAASLKSNGNTESTAKKMTPAQVAEAQRLARICKQQNLKGCGAH